MSVNKNQHALMEVLTATEVGARHPTSHLALVASQSEAQSWRRAHKGSERESAHLPAAHSKDPHTHVKDPARSKLRYPQIHKARRDDLHNQPTDLSPPIRAGIVPQSVCGRMINPRTL